MTGLSRREMMAMAAAAGLVPARHAVAQTKARIEVYDPALLNLLDPAQPVLELASGLGGLGPGDELQPTEGPVWWAEGGYLLFSDIHASRRMKYAPGQGLSVFREGTHQANGLTRDSKGRLVACEHETRRVTREEPDGSLTVIANSFQGRRLNRPNDVVVKSDGAYYFTDQNIAFVPEQWDLPFAGVYRVTADLGTMSLVSDSLIQPNGLAFSPDESILYIADSPRGQVRAFDVMANGMLARQTERVFAEPKGAEPGYPDGLKVDRLGNIYTGGSGGLWIYDPNGKALGRIVHGNPATTNLAFGGSDWKTLYFTSRTSLESVQMKVAGLPVPATALKRG